MSYTNETEPISQSQIGILYDDTIVTYDSNSYVYDDGTTEILTNEAEGGTTTYSNDSEGV